MAIVRKIRPGIRVLIWDDILRHDELISDPKLVKTSRPPFPFFLRSIYFSARVIKKSNRTRFLELFPSIRRELQILIRLENLSDLFSEPLGGECLQRGSASAFDDHEYHPSCSE